MLKNSHMMIQVPVRNMDRAVLFYSKKLGLKLSRRGKGALSTIWSEIAEKHFRLWLGPKHWQIVFWVKNVVTEVSELRQKGVIFQPIRRAIHGKQLDRWILDLPNGRAAFFKDSEGNPIMLFEGRIRKATTSVRKKRSTQRRKFLHRKTTHA